MARTVKDAALLLGAMTGIDPADPVTKESEGRAKTDYTSYLDANGLQGKRIGIEKAFLEGNQGVVALYRQAIELLKNKGAAIIEVELIKACRDLVDAEFTILQYEFRDGLNRYLAGVSTGIKSLAAVIEFNKKNEAKTMPYFKQETLESSEEKKGGLEDKEYKEALKKTLESRLIIDNMLQEHKLDAIAATSIGPANCTDLVNGDYYTGFYFCQPAAMAGYPHITVPMGSLHELPVGLSFISGAYKEGDLFRIAYAYEQASGKRTAPGFLQTAIPG
jgi:amidase